MPGQNAIALVLLVVIFTWLASKALTPPPVVEPTPEPVEQHTCEARLFGPPCSLIATHDDTHIDGTPMWTCTGCHDLAVAYGWLRNDPKDVAL